MSAARPTASFSTLFRVDAIGAPVGRAGVVVGGMFQYPLSGRCYWSDEKAARLALAFFVSVPSFGSMLLEPTAGTVFESLIRGFSTLFRVDAIGAPYDLGALNAFYTSFSTLFRVDAIGALSSRGQ